MEYLFYEIVISFLVAFTAVCLFYYFIPAGFFFMLLYKFNPSNLPKLQSNFPENEQIKREIEFSLYSLFIFALMLTFINWAYKSGFTQLYLEYEDFGYFYLLTSPLVIILIHDFYFYWTHRLLHYPWLLRRVHHIHHLSVSPTPWAMYAFHPVEAVIQFILYVLIAFVIPVHPVVLGLVLFYNAFANAGGHCGFELIPNKWRKHWLFRLNNTVSHHDLHHKKFKHNYSLYYNFLDKLFGTYYEEKS